VVHKTGWAAQIYLLRLPICRHTWAIRQHLLVFLSYTDMDISHCSDCINGVTRLRDSCGITRQPQGTTICTSNCQASNNCQASTSQAL
jgi:hypothetical protein